MTRREEQRKAADRARRDRAPWRSWYGTKAWKLRRSRQLHAEPLCAPCKAAGRSRPAYVANHNPPHRGDRHAFFHGPLESMCKSCHDSAAQREDAQGFNREVGQDGWPRDPRHPFNRERKGGS